MNIKKITQFEHNQKYWQLAFIQGSALGIPGIFIGNQLAKNYGPISALFSICIANLVLWAISLSIVSMSLEGRKNAIQNIRNSLGRIGELIAVVIFVVQFLIWFAIQLQFATEILVSKYSIGKLFSQTQLGAFLGVIIALISMGGIRFIKWICVFSFPLIVCFVISLIPYVGRIHYTLQNFLPSYSVVFIVITAALPGIVNLPTFFRHSLSKNHSIFGLFVMMILITLIECLTIFIELDITTQIFSPPFTNLFHIISTLAFVVISLVCANIINIYYASACWEVIVLRTLKTTEYIVIGLIGTIVFICLRFEHSMNFISALASNYMASLCVILIVDFVIKSTINKNVRFKNQFVSIGCWVISSIFSTIFLVNYPNSLIQSMLLGVGLIIILYIISLFIGETILSIEILLKQERKK